MVRYRYFFLTGLILLLSHCSEEEPQHSRPVNLVVNFDQSDSTIVVLNDSYSAWRLRDTTWYQEKYAICPESLGKIDSLRSPGYIFEIDGLLTPDSCLTINAISNHCELNYQMKPYSGTIEAEWFFIGFLNNGVYEYPPCKPLKITKLIIEKEPDQPNIYTVRGTAIRNTYAASFSITEEKIEVSCCFTTLVGGSDEAQAFERRYWEGLRNSNEYVMQDNTLQFINSTTGEILFFVRREYE